MCLRYLLENMTEADILAVDAEGDVANCSITEYAFGEAEAPASAPNLIRYNFITHLEKRGAEITRAPDRLSAVR